MDGFLTFTLLLGLYFIPSFIATGRKHHNAGAIFVLNFLLGWTLIGWIIALVWSATNPTPATV